MQWFDRFMVAFPDDRPIVSVEVKPMRNRTWAASRCARGSRFENLDIYLGAAAQKTRFFIGF